MRYHAMPGCPCSSERASAFAPVQSPPPLQPRHVARPPSCILQPPKGSSRNLDKKPTPGGERGVGPSASRAARACLYPTPPARRLSRKHVRFQKAAQVGFAALEGCSEAKQACRQDVRRDTHESEHDTATRQTIPQLGQHKTQPTQPPPLPPHCPSLPWLAWPPETSLCPANAASRQCSVLAVLDLADPRRPNERTVQSTAAGLSNRATAVEQGGGENAMRAGDMGALARWRAMWRLARRC